MPASRASWLISPMDNLFTFALADIEVRFSHSSFFLLAFSLLHSSEQVTVVVPLGTNVFPQMRHLIGSPSDNLLPIDFPSASSVPGDINIIIIALGSSCNPGNL